MFRASFKIARVWGIPIKIHISLIILLVIIALNSGLSGNMIELVAILLLETIIFLSVALHELGHSFVAIRKGVRVREITLTFIGGAAQMEDLPRKPMDEFLVAAAGPAVSILLGAGGFFGGDYLNSNHWPILGSLLHQAGIINFFLAGFNLLPSFPMDGGRVLRALLVPKFGRLKATYIASRLGKIMAVLLGIGGLFGIPGVTRPMNFILIAIAFFVYSSAENEYRMVQMQEAYERQGFGSWPPSPPPMPEEDNNDDSGGDQVSISPPPYRKGPESKAPVRPEDDNPFHNLFDR